VLLAAVFTLVFQRVGNLEVPGKAPYALFALTGLVAWTYFSSAVLSASESVVGNSNLVSKVHFPRLTMPISALCAVLPDLLIGLVLLAVGLVVTTTPVGPSLLLLPVALIALFVAAFSVGAWFAALNVKYRDVRQFTPFAMQVGLFVSPVIYASSSLPGATKWISAVNPVAAPIDLFRTALLDAPLPALPSLLGSLATSLVLALAAAEYFRRQQHLFADVI
jgi:lipopolysaccharide transport system permease protein